MTHPLASKGLPRAGRAVGRWAAALVLPALMACTDGYPTEDVPQIDPARMTQAQLLAALNDLGQEPHLGKRWRYRVDPGCELEVRTRDNRRRLVLEGAAVTQRSKDGLTEVLLVPKDGGELMRSTPRGAELSAVRALSVSSMRCRISTTRST
mgnify:CR=1 FL=1